MSDPRVLSFSAQDTTGETTRFTVGTDIIDYIESSRPFGREDLSDPNGDGRFQRRMVAIPDKKGDVVTPMVLTISNQNELYLVRKDDASQNGDGWALIDLSQAFKESVGESLRVRAHGAAWTDDDRITIAVAVDDGDSERSRVFVAYDLSSQSSDWHNIPWIDCGSRENIRVEGIRVLQDSQLGDDDGVWTIMLAGDRGPNDTLYLLRSDAKQSFARALLFNPAVTLEEILDFEVAVHPFLGSGVAVLGINGGTRDLAFRPFPEYKADGTFDTIPPVEPLPCPEGANVLETGQVRQVAKGRRRRTYVGSDIYVGGQGIHQIKAFDIFQAIARGGEITATVVALPNVAPNVQDLIVADAADGSASVWSLLQNGDLNVVKKSALNEDWATPLRLRTGVQAIAPVHGDEHLTTSLLMVYADGKATFLSRDASQGIWQERPLTVPDPEEVVKIPSYGTTLRILGQGSLPKIGLTVKVSASLLSSVVINGNAVFIGPTISFETQTDGNGSIRLFDRVQSLTPATYRFEIDGFDECLDVNPANGMYERFQSISADELRAATISTTGGEEPLLPKNFRTGADRDQVDMLTGSLNELSSLANSSNGVTSGVSFAQANQPFSSTLRSDVVPDNYRWGIQANAHGTTLIEGNTFDQVINAVENVGEFFHNLGEGIADFFEGLTQGIQEHGFQGGLTFVLHKTTDAAEDAFEFICAVGNEIKRFTLKTVEAVGGAFQWLWQQVKVPLEKVWEYLKHRLGWQDILLVRDFIVDFIDAGLEEIPHFVDSISDSVENSFDELISQVNQWKSPASSQSEGSHAQKSSTPITQTYQGSQGIIDRIMGNSAVSWLSDQFQSMFDEIIEIEDFDVAGESLQTMSNFIDGIINDFADELSDSFEQISATVTGIFGEGLPDFNDFSFDNLKTLIVDIGAEVIETILQLIKKIVIRVLDLVGDLIDLLRGLISANIRFPFIEKLVKLVTDGNTEIDTSFRLIDLVSLILAVPTTMIYKVIFGKAPLQPGDAVSLPFGQTISVQSAMGRFQRFVNTISIAAQLALTGILIFASFDKKSEGRKRFKGINVAAIVAILVTRIVNDGFAGRVSGESAILDGLLSAMLVFSIWESYNYNKHVKTSPNEAREFINNLVSIICGIVYTVVPIIWLVSDEESDEANTLSLLSDVFTGLPIALGSGSSFSEGPLKLGLAAASGLAGFAGLCVSIEYLVQASQEA